MGGQVSGRLVTSSPVSSPRAAGDVVAGQQSAGTDDSFYFLNEYVHGVE
jgi:hypothetical protein